MAREAELEERGERVPPSELALAVDTIPGSSFSFTPNNFSVPASGSQTVQATLNLPSGVPPGEYHGTITVTSNDGTTAINVTIVVEETVEIIVDDLDPGFQRFGPSGGWYEPFDHENNDMYNDHAYFTYCTYPWQSPTVNNWATWTPNLPQAGQWEIFAFVPWVSTGRADTTRARYQVHSATGDTTVEISHDRGTAEWVSLGTFTFNAGMGGYVRLEDVTPDWYFIYNGQQYSKTIKFDAMKFVPK